MSLDTDGTRIEAPDLPPGTPVRLAGAAPSLWRVIDRGGRVIGHLQALDVSGGIRYRARRFHAASRAFLDLGEFWSVGDAIDCLRFAR
ncbi:hypothetical protein [Microbacterium sulfonylureivorans]|uniref:hypothetical protein n=1 Tax=Microbacterium sulfonylureivorans TaxID=2486854 RepID=UPI000FD7D587|nr:hypothetical protein [Microbacterium sulfonylureivorans]